MIPAPVLALLGLALAGVVVAIPLAGPGATPHRQRALALGLAGTALLHLGGLAVWWASVGHGPFLDRFEVLASNAWTLLVLFLVAAWLEPTLRGTARPVLALVALQLAAGLWIGPRVKTLPPVMDSPWLTAHAIAYKLALAAAVLALALGLPPWRGTVPRLQEAQHRWAGYAFVGWTAGMLLGSVWGDQAFGTFWNWDAVELWALAGWAALGSYLHALRFFRVGPRARAWLFLAAFSTLVVTLYVAPLSRQGFHAGSFVK
jgi:ABC-type transport system involved in cytochrome c biogenesis permease subunit